MTPELKDQFDQLQMELRGYELAKLVDGGWEVVSKYRATEQGRIQAITDQRALEWRSKKERRPQTYAVRPLVSIAVDFAAREAPQVLLPDVTDAIVGTGDLVLEADAPESLIVKPEGDEFAGGGFKATPEQGAVGNVEIPYNYDQLASGIDIPNPWGNNDGP